MKTKRYQGGKLMYRSIEKPLKLYSHGMRIVDITNPNNQKEIRNKYVESYHQEAMERNFLLGQYENYLENQHKKPQTKKKFKKYNMQS
jgi:hypothetical protein